MIIRLKKQLKISQGVPRFETQIQRITLYEHMYVCGHFFSSSVHFKNPKHSYQKDIKRKRFKIG